MALFQAYKGNKSNLPKTFDEGKVYVLSDAEELFIDTSNLKRIQITDIIKIDSENDLPLAPLDKFYFIKSTNALVKNIDGNWVNIGGGISEERVREIINEMITAALSKTY